MLVGRHLWYDADSLLVFCLSSFDLLFFFFFKLDKSIIDVLKGQYNAHYQQKKLRVGHGESAQVFAVERPCFYSSFSPLSRPLSSSSSFLWNQDWRATFLLDCILQMKYTARVELWTASTLKAARQGGDPPAKPLQVVERPVFASPARAKREEDGGNNNISNFESTYPKVGPKREEREN